MPHVDEGRLHAYLDGGLQSEDADASRALERHLDGCADCRARLEDARRLRDDASALLEGAALEVALPPFSQIRERAGRSADASRPAARTSIRRRLVGTPFGRLAWAASLVLALGLGWLLRDRMPERTERIAFELPAAPAGDPVRRPSAGSAGSEAASSSEVLREQVAVSERPGSGDTRTAAQDDPPAPARRAAARDGQEGTAAAAEGARESDAVEAFAAEPVEWRVVDRGAAERALGTRLTVVGNLPVVGYAVSQQGAATVRVVQRLDEGTLVRLVQRAPDRPAAAVSQADVAESAGEPEERAQARVPESDASMVERAARAPTLPQPPGLESLMIEAPVGWNARTRVHGDLVVTLEAPLPRDSLEVLLTRLRQR